MGKYRKRPAVIEAFRWTGGPDQTEDPDWIKRQIKAGFVSFSGGNMFIKTLEGTMQASQVITSLEAFRVRFILASQIFSKQHISLP